MKDSDVELYRKLQRSPIFFVEKMFGLKPQISPADPFVKGKNITWQQYQILLSVEDAINNRKPKRISVASAHGIGKTATVSWLVLWYLFSFKDAQIACTAPTADQMYDVLWKEIAKWIAKMPKVLGDKYEWSTTHIRITESPETWFARAKTARKEAPEALAGVHGDHVMLIADEASGIPQEIFNTAEGSLTDKNTLTILISNPTRLIGYFYDTHHGDKANWQILAFNSLESPIVDTTYNERIMERHGEDSDEYRVRVLGKFPKEDAVDEKGFVPVFSNEEIRMADEVGDYLHDTKLGVDPSGEGQDETAWLKRDDFKAEVVGTEKISTSKSIAEKTITLMMKHDVRDKDVMIDNFGVGADVAKDIALSAYHYDVGTVNVGDNPIDEIYLNKRAEGYFAIKKWFREGGTLLNNEMGRKLKAELLTIRFKRNLAGTIQIMSKDEMRKQGIKSPNLADALMLTFVKTRRNQEAAHQYMPEGLARSGMQLPRDTSEE